MTRGREPATAKLAPGNTHGSGSVTATPSGRYAEVRQSRRRRRSREFDPGSAEMDRLWHGGAVRLEVSGLDLASAARDRRSLQALLQPAATFYAENPERLTSAKRAAGPSLTTARGSRTARTMVAGWVAGLWGRATRQSHGALRSGLPLSDREGRFSSRL